MAVFVDFHIIIMLAFIVLVGCVSSSFGTNEEKVSIDVAASGQHGRNEIFDEPNKYYANENKYIWTNRHQARSPTVLNVEKHDDKDNFGHSQHADSYAEQLARYFGKHIRKRRAMVKRQLMDSNYDELADRSSSYEDGDLFKLEADYDEDDEAEYFDDEDDNNSDKEYTNDDVGMRDATAGYNSRYDDDADLEEDYETQEGEGDYYENNDDYDQIPDVHVVQSRKRRETGYGEVTTGNRFDDVDAAIKNTIKNEEDNDIIDEDVYETREWFEDDDDGGSDRENADTVEENNNELEDDGHEEDNDDGDSEEYDDGDYEEDDGYEEEDDDNGDYEVEENDDNGDYDYEEENDDDDDNYVEENDDNADYEVEENDDNGDYEVEENDDNGDYEVEENDDNGDYEVEENDYNSDFEVNENDDNADYEVQENDEDGDYEENENEANAFNSNSERKKRNISFKGREYEDVEDNTLKRQKRKQSIIKLVQSYQHITKNPIDATEMIKGYEDWKGWAFVQATLLTATRDLLLNLKKTRYNGRGSPSDVIRRLKRRQPNASPLYINGFLYQYYSGNRRVAANIKRILFSDTWRH